MDGSEPGDTVPAAVLSGAPTDLQARTVRYGCSSILGGRVSAANSRTVGSIAPRSRRRSQDTGTAITGGWTGISCRRATDGRTRLLAGSHPLIACKARTSASSRKKMRSCSPRSRDTSTLCRSRTSAGLPPRRMRTTSCTRRRSSNTSRPNKKISALYYVHSCVRLCLVRLLLQSK